MEAPSARYILTRAIFFLCLIVAVIYGLSFFKKYQRKSALAAELKALTSESSFFQQFYAEDARKTLLRAIGIIADQSQAGVPTETAIDRAIGIAEINYFSSDEDREDPTYRQKLIQETLRSNYANFLKLGYKPDFRTIQTLRDGALPLIPDGPQAGEKPEVGPIIDPAISPGMDKVIANLEIRPPRPAAHVPTDIEIAAAKKLANDLQDAGIIEEPVLLKILARLSGPSK